MQKILPCYECGGVARVGGELVTLLETTIPATDDPALVPQLRLTASAQKQWIFGKPALNSANDSAAWAGDNRRFG